MQVTPARRVSFQFSTALGVVLLVLVGALSTIPVAFVLLGSVTVGNPGQPMHFGLDGWREVLFTSRTTIGAIGTSFLLSVRAPIGVVVGFILAWLIVRARIPGHGLFEFGFWIAFFLPALPVTFGWILLLDPNYGLINEALKTVLGISISVFNIYSIPGILWVHLVSSTIPIMVILLTPALRRFDSNLEDAARVCGSGRMDSLRRITVPILAPAILVAMIAGFIRSLEAFEVEQLLGVPSGIMVYSTRIYDYINQQPANYSSAMALSTFFLVLLFILAFLYQHFTATRQYYTVTGRGAGVRPVDIGTWKYVASAICVGLLVISVLVPIVMLCLASFMRGFGFFFINDPYTTANWQMVLGDRIFGRSMVTSLQVGFGVAILGVALYSLVSYVIVRTRMAGRNLLSLLVWLPWAIPGILLGMSMLWLIVTAPVLNVLYGTIGGLILALLVKDMPLGAQMLKTSFMQISDELEQASRVCGANWLKTYRYVVLPLIAPMVLSVFILLFINSLRDISTTILLTSPQARPLPVLMLEFAMDGNMSGASVVATIIALLAVGVAIVARAGGLRLSGNL
jgi:iron(III) transport system permease protein